MQAVDQSRLDYLRGIAALYVLINHVRGTFFVGGRKLLSDDPSAFDYVSVAMLQATSLGTEFVVLFFVVSGFAMAHSIRHTTDTGRFYLKRIVRIWPPYIAATFFALLVAEIIGATDIQQRLLPVLFYVEPHTSLTPQFWSLPYEIVFYALCPILLVRRSWAMLGVSAVLTVGAVIAWGPMLNPAPNLLLNFAGNALLFFAAGASTYWYIEKVPILGPKALALVAVGLLACIWAFKVLLGGSNIASNLGMIVLTVLAIRNLPKLPGNLGHCSYSIYIFHYALIALIAWAISPWVAPREIESPIAWLLVVPPVLGASYLLYLVTERPCNLLVSRLRRKRPDRDSVEASRTDDVEGTHTSVVETSTSSA